MNPIPHVETLALKPGDILIFRYSKRLNEQEIFNAVRDAKDFITDHKISNLVSIVHGGCELQVFRPLHTAKPGPKTKTPAKKSRKQRRKNR